MPSDFYKELGVAKDATPEQLKKAYRKLASELHPDKNPGKPEIEARFKTVNRAYQTLSDKKKKALYDEFGEEGLREGFNVSAARAYRRAGGGGFGQPPSSRGGGGDFGFEEIFSGGGRGGGFGSVMEDLFGGSRSQRKRERRGADLASEVAIDFDQAIKGATVLAELQPGSEPVSIRIPAGAGDGDRVRVAGHGAPGTGGGPPGDLVITVRVRTHPHFERDGLDLHLNLPITPGEAYSGAKVAIPTPQGEVTLKVPAHAQSGQVVRLKERGVKRKDDKGDLYVRFLVRLPESESKAVADAVEALENAMTGDVRKGIAL